MAEWTLERRAGETRRKRTHDVNNRPGATGIIGAEVVARANGQGFETVARTPEWFAHCIKSEIVKWSKVIRSAGIKSAES